MSYDTGADFQLPKKKLLGVNTGDLSVHASILIYEHSQVIDKNIVQI